MKNGALSTLLLPDKSIHKKQLEQRSNQAIKKREHHMSTTNASDTSKKIYYKDLDGVRKNLTTFKAEGWQFTIQSSLIKIFKHEKDHLLPKFEIHIDESLAFTIRVFGWLLPVHHPIYKETMRTVHYQTISNLMHRPECQEICGGIQHIAKDTSISTKIHVLPKNVEVFDCEEYHFCQDEVLRSTECNMLVNCEKVCSECTSQTKVAEQREKKNNLPLLPAKLNAPVSVTAQKRLLLTMQQLKNENKLLKADIGKIKEELLKSSLLVQKDLDQDLQDVFNSVDERKISPFMNLFWEEQMKYLKSTPSQATILHKNYETASPFPSVNVVSLDSGVTGCQFSGETLPTITTLTEGEGRVPTHQSLDRSISYCQPKAPIYGIFPTA